MQQISASVTLFRNPSKELFAVTTLSTGRTTLDREALQQPTAEPGLGKSLAWRLVRYVAVPRLWATSCAA